MTAARYRPATHAKYYEQAPDIVDADGTQSWITRSGNMVVDRLGDKFGTRD